MLNGQLLCQATPCQKTVTPGTHQIRIEKERYNGWSKNIDTKKGSIVHGKLTPKFGFLKINTTVSGVELSLDGQSLGKTPIKPIELDAGIHKIEVNDKCYTGPDYRFQTLANKTEEVKYPLKARQSGIKVSLSDHLENALKGQVYVDDVYLGETPSTYQLPLCSKQLIVKYNGQAVEKILSLEEKKVLEFDLQIEEYKDRTLLLGSWSEKWGCDGEETDINYNDQYNITYNNDWEIEAPDYAHYRFADTTFRNGHLSTTLYNENDMSDVFIIQYELNMKNPNRLYGRAQTNKGVDVSICWNRITHK